MPKKTDIVETPLMASLREYKNPLFICCFGILIGSIFYFKEINFLLLILLCVLILLTYFLLKQKKFLILLFSVVFSYCYCLGYFKIFIPNLDSLLNQKIIYVGEITTEPETYGNFYTKYNLNLKSTIYNSFIHTINAKVQVIGSKYEKYQKGDIVQVSGVLKSPKSALLPGLFDERKYLFTKGIKYILKADSGSLVFLDRGLVSFFYDRISYLRQKIITV